MLKLRPSFAFVAFTIVLGVTGTGCNGQNNSAAGDLLNAFSSGCSINGTYLEAALSQTQAMVTTIQDLQSHNSCSGLNGALNSTQNLQTLVSSLAQNQFTAQISTLGPVQQLLLLQMQKSTNESDTAILASQFSSNLLNLAEAQAALVTASGGLSKTSFQTGSIAASGYVSQLFSDQTNLLACSKDNPAMGAQVAAGMLGVAGSFAGPVAGVALSLAGGLLSSILDYVHNSSYQNAVENLNAIQMTTALPCGLEQMATVYCQAQDLMDIAHLEECAYNPGAAGCAALNAESSNPRVATTDFWQGIDVLARDLPALQLWINQVVTGIIPSDPYAAQKMNDAATNVTVMDSVSRFAQGVMKSEETNISSLPNPGDQLKELHRGLGILQTVLAANSTNPNCLNNFGGSIGGNCSNTPILSAEGSATQILYDIVGRNPSADPGCTPNAALGSACHAASDIPLDGVAGITLLATWQNIEANAGGLPGSAANGLHLIDTTLARAIQIERQYLNTDPSDVLEKVNIPAGEGLPAAVKALHQIQGFLKTSLAYFSDPSQVPDNLLDGGAMSRAGIIGNIQQTAAMVDGVLADLAQVNGSSTDLFVLNNIYAVLNLEKDRNYIHNRLSDLITLDVHTRIKSGQVPSNIYEILSQSEVDPAVGLMQIPPESLETTLAQLGQSQVTSQMNLKEFGGFFSGGFQNVIANVRKQADVNDEPMVADPRVSPSRASQARICLLLATTQDMWPKDVDVKNCAGVAYVSGLTGKTLAFDDYYAQLKSRQTTVPQRMCEFYRFYRLSQNYTHEHQAAH